MTTLVVSAIKHGTVIDHIPAGKATKIAQVLGLHLHKKRISIGINLPSNILKNKDLLKIEDRELTPEEVNQVAIIAPDATISIIRDYNITNKFKIALPETIKGIVSCTNKQCITNHEPMETLFYVENQQLRCKYCNLFISSSEIQEL